MKIIDLKDGDSFSGPLLVSDCKKCVNTNGKPYLAITFQDQSSQISARLWEINNEEEILKKGNVVHVEGKVLSYNKSLQIRLFKVTSDTLGLNPNDFAISSPVKKEELVNKLKAYVDSISDNDLKLLVSNLVNKYLEKLSIWPAAVRNHHEFESGLIYHSVTMADLGLSFCAVYPKLNRDLVLAGCLVHDFGKMIELSGLPNAEFTLDGKLIGHISLGFYEVRKEAERLGMHEFESLKKEEQTKSSPLFHKHEMASMLEHIILSHHGKYEFGSPVLPLTKEAYAVSCIDDFDAKMMILDKAYEGAEKGENTSKIMTMDNRFFYNPFSLEASSSPSGLSLEKELDELKR